MLKDQHLIELDHGVFGNRFAKNFEFFGVDNGS